MTGWIVGLGDWTLFSLTAILGMFRPSGWRDSLVVAYRVGVGSLPVVILTGVFLGLVLAVQAYAQFHAFRLETTLGGVISVGLLRELGPVLTAFMLAGRVGSSMAAELGTMHVTDQIDAMQCLGVNPIHHLVTPRLIACLAMIPFLSVIASVTGILASAAICSGLYDVEPYHYWRHARNFVTLTDILSGLFKAMVFGGTLSLISCHRGFHSSGGAVGVGRAATEAFVYSFLAILALDFFLVLFLESFEANYPAYD